MNINSGNLNSNFNPVDELAKKRNEENVKEGVASREVDAKNTANQLVKSKNKDANSFLIGTLNVITTTENQKKTLHLTLNPNNNDQMNQFTANLPHLFQEIDQKEWHSCCIEFEKLINSSPEIKEALDKCEKIQIRAFKNGSFALYAKSVEILSSDIDKIVNKIFDPALLNEDAMIALSDSLEKGERVISLSAKVKETFIKAWENQHTFEQIDALERLAIHSVRAAKSGAKAHKKRKFKPKVQLNDNWSRMYHKIKEIEGGLTPEARQKVRFFLIQYLAKVASCFTNQTRNTRFLTNPIQQEEDAIPTYFRSFQNPFLKILEDLLKKEICPNFSPRSKESYNLITLSDGPAFLDILKKSQSVCTLTLNSSQEEIEEKLKATCESPKEKYIAFNIPAEWIGDPDLYMKLSHFNERINSTCRSMNLTFPNIIGFGEKEGAHFTLCKSEFNLRDLRECNGYVPTLQQTSRLLSFRNISFETLFAKAGVVINYATFNEPKVSTLGSLSPKVIPYMSKVPSLGGHFVSSFDKLIENPTYRAFSKFIRKEDNPQAIPILCSNLLNCINGMQRLPLDESFQKLGLTPFLEESYVRVLNYMEVIMALNTNDPLHAVTLANYQNLIYEEIFLWLENSMDEKLANETIQSILQNQVLQGASLRPSLSFMLNTGVRCATSIRKACQNIHGDHFNTFCFQDSYFEIVGAAEKSLKNLSVITFPDFEASFKENLEKLRKENQKLDLIYVDPQGSLSVYYPLTTSHNVDDLISYTLDNEMAKIPLTIAMDLTIGKINDDSISNVINKYRDKIEAGILNIVLYRSIQKFDSFGTDKLSGGYVQVYSKNKAFLDSFEKTRVAEENDIDPLNKKGLAHLYANCAEGLDLYRQVSFDNAQYFYDRVNKDFIYPSKLTKHLPFYLGQRKDVNNFFAGIVRRDATLFNFFYNTLLELGAMSRPSFGFSHFTTIIIPRIDEKNTTVTRICFGLEERAKIDRLIEKFNTILSLYNELYSAFSEVATSIGLDESTIENECNFRVTQYLKEENTQPTTEVLYQKMIPALIEKYVKEKNDQLLKALLIKFENNRQFEVNHLLNYSPSSIEYKKYLLGAFLPHISNKTFSKLLNSIDDGLSFGLDLSSFFAIAFNIKQIEKIPVLLEKLFLEPKSTQNLSILTFLESDHFFEMVSSFSGSELESFEKSITHIDSPYLKIYLNSLAEAKVRYEHSKVLKDDLDKMVENENIDLSILENEYKKNNAVFIKVLDYFLKKLIQNGNVNKIKSINFGGIPISPFFLNSLKNKDVFKELTSLKIQSFGDKNSQRTAQPSISDDIVEIMFSHSNLKNLQVPFEGWHSTEIREKIRIKCLISKIFTEGIISGEFTSEEISIFIQTYLKKVYEFMESRQKSLSEIDIWDLLMASAPDFRYSGILQKIQGLKFEQILEGIESLNTTNINGQYNEYHREVLALKHIYWRCSIVDNGIIPRVMPSAENMSGYEMARNLRNELRANPSTISGLDYGESDLIDLPQDFADLFPALEWINLEQMMKLKKLPQCLLNFRKLKHINLSHTQLDVNLPDEFAKAGFTSQYGNLERTIENPIL